MAVTDDSTETKSLLDDDLYTLGQLLHDLKSNEEAFSHNIGIARKYEAQGSPASLWWDTQAKVLRGDYLKRIRSHPSC